MLWSYLWSTVEFSSQFLRLFLRIFQHLSVGFLVFCFWFSAPFSVKLFLYNWSIVGYLLSLWIGPITPIGKYLVIFCSFFRASADWVVLHKLTRLVRSSFLLRFHQVLVPILPMLYLPVRLISYFHGDETITTCGFCGNSRSPSLECSIVDIRNSFIRNVNSTSNLTSLSSPIINQNDLCGSGLKINLRMFSVTGAYIDIPKI